MFEKALILRAGVERRVDLGLVAETLFLYGSTQLLLDRASLIALSKNISGGDLLAMFDRGEISLSYLRQNFAVLTAGMPICHNFGAFTLGGTDRGAQKISNYQEEIVTTLERELGNSRETRKLADAIASRAKLHRFKGVPEKEKTVCDLMRSDIRDKKFVKEAVKATLAELVPEYELPKRFRYVAY